MIDAGDDAANDAEIETIVIGDLLGAADILDIGFEDAVENVVGGQGILIGLIGAKLGGGRLDQSGFGDQFPAPIDEIGELVDHKFWNVGDDGEAASHIAIESAIADSHLRFIAGAEKQGAKFIGESHQEIAADARLKIFLGGILRERCEEGIEGGAVGIKDGTDGEEHELDAEVRGEEAGIADAALGGIGAGHGHGEDLAAAESVRGDAGDEGGIDAAAKAEDDFVEAAFTDVIAGAADEGAVGHFEFIGGLGMEIAGGGGGIEEDEIFLEAAGLCGDRAGGGNGDAGAIEDQGIIAAHLIDIDDGDAVAAGQSAEHIEAQATLIESVRRGGDIDEQASSLPRQLGDGVARIELLCPKVLIVPDIFADGDAQLSAVEGEQVLGMGGLEVAAFVEYIVGRQKHFALFEGHDAAGEQGGGIGDGLAGIVLCAADVAHNRRQGDVAGKEVEFAGIALDERRALDEILRRIAAEAELGKDGEIGATGFCLGGECQDARGIAGEITDGGIELCEGENHAGPEGRERRERDAGRAGCGEAESPHRIRCVIFDGLWQAGKGVSMMKRFGRGPLPGGARRAKILPQVRYNGTGVDAKSRAGRKRSRSVKKERPAAACAEMAG